MELEEEYVGVDMTPEKAEVWERLRYTTPLGPGKKGVHLHPILAASRYVLEKEACRLALEEGAEVYDVGGAPHRTFAHLGQQGWYIMPELHPGDGNRKKMCPKECRMRILNCILEEVTFDRPFTLVMVNSAYYIDPYDLHSLIDNPLCRGAYVVGHDFSGDTRGGFYEEATWARDGVCVQMHVTGNSMPYHHKHLAWTVGWRGVDGQVLSAKTVDSIGGITHLWKVEALRGPPGPRSILPSEVSAPTAMYGPLQSSSVVRASFNDAVVSEYQIDLDHAFVVGNYIYIPPLFQNRTISVNIPRGAVAVAANYCVNRARDPSCFQGASFRVRNYLSNSRLTPEEIPMAITVATALGMFANLENEVVVASTFQRRFGPLINMSNTLFTFQKPKYLPVYFAFGLIGALAIVAFGFDFSNGGSEVKVVATVVCAALTLLIAMAMFLFHRLVLWQRNASIQSFREGLTSDQPIAGNLAAGEHLSLEEGRFPGSTHVVVPHPDAQKYTIIREETLKDRDMSFASGLFFPEAVVNVLQPTQKVEESAVSNRVLRPVPPVSVPLVRSLEAFVQTSPKFQFESIQPSLEGFNSWLDGLREKYPAQYVRDIKTTFEEIEGGAPVTMKCKPFVKIEKGKPVTPNGQKPVKPRLIQAPDITVKAIGGYYVHLMYKAIKRHWGKHHPNVVYASGVTTDALGLHVDEFIHKNGGEGNVEAINLDYSAFDTTLSAFLQVPTVRTVYSSLGCNHDIQRWFLSTLTEGVTPQGVKYKPLRVEIVREGPSATWVRRLLKAFEIEYKEEDETGRNGEALVRFTMHDMQMSSGRPDTNLMDTLVNAEVACWAMCIAEITNFLLLICGDDAFLMVQKGEGATALDYLTRFARGVGLEPEAKLCKSRSEWEFCSKLAWFADDNGSVRTVWGPKPGRVLSRAGWSVVEPNEENVASTAGSLKRDAAHVPLLNLYANKLGALCAKKKIKPTKNGSKFDGLVASKAFKPAAENWIIMEERYGFDEAIEPEFNLALSHCDDLPAAVNFPAIVDMVERDE